MNRTGSPSAIAKVVAVAEALAEHRRLSRIAQVTGLPVSTVHRILQELVSQGWVREGEERDYTLGPGLLRLAGYATDDSEPAHPALHAWSERRSVGFPGASH
jgi:DNA-binding IclR family transcriptional regulator